MWILSRCCVRHLGTPTPRAVMVEDSLMTGLVEDHSPALLARSTKQTDSIVAFAVLI